MSAKILVAVLLMVGSTIAVPIGGYGGGYSGGYGGGYGGGLALGGSGYSHQSIVSHAAPLAVAHAPLAVAHAPLAVAHAPLAVAHAPLAIAKYAAAPVHKQVIDYVDTHPAYKFEYAVHDAHTGDVKEQSESRDGDVVHGSYSLIEPDGTKRIVEYTADDHNGFNAIVHREHNAHPQVIKKIAVAAPIYKAAPLLTAYHH